MKYIFTIFAFVLTLFSYSQNRYSSGFEKGFKDGYCYEQKSGCIAPITPITPIPKIGESSDSYDDGYKRGFQVGLDNYRSSTPNVQRQRYETSDSKYIDVVGKPRTIKYSNSQIQKMYEKKAELDGYFTSIKNTIDSKTEPYIDDFRFVELHDKYREELSNLIASYNRNRMQILSDEEKFNVFFWELATVLSDFMNELSDLEENK